MWGFGGAAGRRDKPNGGSRVQISEKSIDRGGPNSAPGLRAHLISSFGGVTIDLEGRNTAIVGKKLVVILGRRKPSPSPSGTCQGARQWSKLRKWLRPRDWPSRLGIGADRRYITASTTRRIEQL